MTTIEELEAKLLKITKELQEEVQDIKARFEAESNKRRGLMRDTHRCSACTETKILHFSKIKGHTYNSNPLGVTTHWFSLLGQFEGFVCVSCGHTELQLKNAHELEGKKDIQTLEAPETDQGPYR